MLTVYHGTKNMSSYPAIISTLLRLSRLFILIGLRQWFFTDVKPHWSKGYVLRGVKMAGHNVT